MAEIIIQPGEVFEHIHSYKTVTKLIEGKIRFFLNGIEVGLREGEEINVPEGIAHRSVNIGVSIARLDCGYCPGPSPQPFPPPPMPVPPPPAG